MPYLELACARSGGRYTVEFVAQSIFQRVFQIWYMAEPDGTLRAVVVTHINRYPTGLQVAQVVLAAGRGINRKTAVMMRDVLMGWAVFNDCKKIEFTGRKGFLRLVPGLRQIAITAEMDV